MSLYGDVVVLGIGSDKVYFEADTERECFYLLGGLDFQSLQWGAAINRCMKVREAAGIHDFPNCLECCRENTRAANQ